MLLQRAVDAAAHLGPDALPVRSRLLAAQGRLARTPGRIPESREYFKKALALCSQPDKTTGDLALASISMGAVSYTHLDVYKRQRQYRFCRV